MSLACYSCSSCRLHFGRVVNFGSAVGVTLRSRLACCGLYSTIAVVRVITSNMKRAHFWSHWQVLVGFCHGFKMSCGFCVWLKSSHLVDGWLFLDTSLLHQDRGNRFWVIVGFVPIAVWLALKFQLEISFVNWMMFSPNIWPRWNPCWRCENLELYSVFHRIFSFTIASRWMQRSSTFLHPREPI